MKTYYFNGTETNYEVSKTGIVRNRNTKKEISQWENSGGYMYVSLYINGTKYNIGVHVLVASVYIPNPNNKPQVNHKNIHKLSPKDNKKDNSIENLEWVTQSENNIHAINNGLRKPVHGENVHFAKTTDKTVLDACEYLMKGYDIIQISKLTGITPKMLYMIRDKKIWKHITLKYNFPKIRVPYSNNYSMELRDDIFKLIDDGYCNDDICSLLSLEKTKPLSKTLYDIRYRRRKVQRPVVTDDMYIININL